MSLETTTTRLSESGVFVNTWSEFQDRQKSQLEKSKKSSAPEKDISAKQKIVDTIEGVNSEAQSAGVDLKKAKIKELPKDVQGTAEGQEITFSKNLLDHIENSESEKVEEAVQNIQTVAKHEMFHALADQKDCRHNIRSKNMTEGFAQSMTNASVEGARNMGIYANEVSAFENAAQKAGISIDRLKQDVLGKKNELIEKQLDQIELAMAE